MGRLRWHPRRRRIRCNPVRVWLAALCILFVWLCLKGYYSLGDLVAVYGEARCRNLVTEAVLGAVAETDSDEKLYNFTEQGENRVLSLDGNAVRQYQAVVGKNLTDRLENLREQSHQVALGTVLGSTFFMDRGPTFTIRFVPVGSAQVTLGSSLLEAGINQVLYQVTMDLAVTMTVLLPGGTRTVCCTQRVVVGETLITGQTPLVYGAPNA